MSERKVMDQIPVDVMREIANKIASLKGEILQLRFDAHAIKTKQEIYERLQSQLEDMLDKWQTLFPETCKDY